MIQKPKKRKILIFTVVQFALGMIFLFNAIPFDYTIRLFGLILIATSPLWIVIFKITRMEKTKELDKKEKEDQNKKDNEKNE